MNDIPALGFLHALLAAPADSVPYLVYADWLDERNDPRGELMRLAAARITTPADDRADLDARLDGWLAVHAAPFLGPLAQVLEPQFGLFDTAPAWLLFLHADLPAHDQLDLFSLKARLLGTVVQGEQEFPTIVRVTGRAGNRVQGRQECRFGYGTGRWKFSGVVLAGRVAYVTDRVSGAVTFPGLYQGEIADNRLVGHWRVPSFHQGGAFAFSKDMSR